METSGKDTAYRNVETRWRHQESIQLTGMQRQVMMETSGKHTAYRDVEPSNDGDIRKAYSLQGCRDR